MLKQIGGETQVKGDGVTLLGEFYTMAHVIYHQVYKKMWKGEAKDKFFKDMAEVTLTDEQLEEHLHSEFKNVLSEFCEKLDNMSEEELDDLLEQEADDLIEENEDEGE